MNTIRTQFKIEGISVDCHRHYLHSLTYLQISLQLLKMFLSGFNASDFSVYTNNTFLLKETNFTNITSMFLIN